MNPQIQSKESMLTESIKHFLTSYHSGGTDYSSFESIFFRLIQTMLDPPLEITWFYSAITCHAAKSSSQNNPSTRVLIAKDLLNLLFSCSNLSSASKKIAMLAPVVYELYNIVCDSRKSGICVNMEVDKLVENFVSYVMMSAKVCDFGNGDVKFDNVLVCFEDLVRVWTIDRGGGSCNLGEILRVFFPLLTDGTWKEMKGRCGIGELVGIVMCEVFFLSLYLKFRSGMCTENFLKGSRDHAVQTIKGFRNCFFLDMLLKMLLEPSLPVAALLSSEEAVVLQKVLYDAVILFDYSSYSGRWVDIRSKKLALLWLLVAERAIQFARAKSDEVSAISYLNVFRESQLVAELIRWMTFQAGIVDQNATPDISTPKALIRWLLVLEDIGLRVFDHSRLVLHAKALAGEEHEYKNLNQNIDLNEDQDMDDFSIGEIPGTFYLMGTKIKAGKKRKEALSYVEESRVKLVKFERGESSNGGNLLPFSSNNGQSEIISVSSDDDDMELAG